MQTLNLDPENPRTKAAKIPEQEYATSQLSIHAYSVVHSDENNFCRDVVLESFNIKYIDEDSISDQK